MESLSSTTKNRWDECSTAAKMLVECVEHYYAKRCEVVSWLFLSVKYKIKKENIKFIITQNVTNYLLIRKNCFLCFRLKVLWNSQHFQFHQWQILLLQQFQWLRKFLRLFFHTLGYYDCLTMGLINLLVCPWVFFFTISVKQNK